MNADELRTAVHPTLGEGVWVAPSADVIGDVTIGSHASIWYQCVLRGDIAPITIGESTNIQDLTMVHVDVDRPCRIGNSVGIGHRAIIHGCDIEDGCLIGMGAIVLSHAVVGVGSVVAAGALVTEGAQIPPGSLVVGVPGRVVRPVDEELRGRVRLTVGHYRALKELHAGGRWQQPG
ncbi:MAG: gamma carbonic anhydrase family protein [marine benthic group bacterium]|nr:gamma carbonic anhydrase family protein [Gemmatimonadota bacterium]MCL7984184.1 gamma carbonic anhydrase family protein [Gemmatimonadota bacterium]